MSNILSSASKIVFVMVALGVHLALVMNKITGEQYMILASMVFTYYFANKGDNSGGTGEAATQNLGK